MGDFRRFFSDFAPFARAVRLHTSASSAPSKPVDISALYIATVTHALARKVRDVHSSRVDSPLKVFRLTLPYYGPMRTTLMERYDGFIRRRADGFDFLGGILLSGQRNVSVLAMPVVESIVNIAQGRETISDDIATCVGVICKLKELPKVRLLPVYIGSAELDDKIANSGNVLMPGLLKSDIVDQIVPYASADRFWPTTKSLILASPK